MNYPDALEFLLGRTDYERWPGHAYASRFDLRRMQGLLERVGNPHLGPRTVHVAGSKGKGSTAAMIAAALQAAGYSTGLYTSPHLITLRERIKVDNKQMLKTELAKLSAELAPHVREMDGNPAYGELTTYELLTAAAFLHFREKKVDFQVLETGLGGRLDATNTASPEVCAITSISLDHTQVLGDTVGQIASEKAGIIKSGVPVVTAPQQEEALSVIKKACLDRGCRLTEVGRDITWEKTGSIGEGQSLLVRGTRDQYWLTIPLLGEYQLENAANAVGVLEVLDISRDAIEGGLPRTDWPGRLQLVRRRPRFVVDGAHSPESARKLAGALRQYFYFQHLILIIGASADKDLPGIIAEFKSLPAAFVATRSRHPRSLDPRAVADACIRQGLKTEISPDIPQAVKKALASATPRDLICATGSLFVVGEVLEYMRGLRPETYPPSGSRIGV